MWWLEKQGHKVFHKQTHFQFKTPRNFVKPIYNLQKCKKKMTQKPKLTLNPKSFEAQICFLDIKKKHIISTPLIIQNHMT